MSESFALNEVEWVEYSADATERVPPSCRARTVSCFLALFLVLSKAALAQESSPPQPFGSPSSVARNVRVSFVPPPLEGRISLGIYDANGKLVRVLHRESTIENFTIGHDALITTWDGKNDAGEDLPAGKYHASGYTVGALSVEGIGYFFNDWVTDEKSLRIKRVENLALNSRTTLVFLVTLVTGKNEIMVCDASTGMLLSDLVKQPNGIDYYDFVSPGRLGVRIEAGKLSLITPEDWRTVTWPNLVQPEAAALGRHGNVWVIDRTEFDSSKLELKEFSPQGEFLRRMEFAPGDPQPKIIRAAANDDRIYLLEENTAVQRVRGLTVVAPNTNATQQSVFDWKVNFEKKIVAHKEFSLDDGKPIATPGKATPEKITQKLQPNPLDGDKPGNVELAIGFDSNGSCYLKTSDGLPLRTISDTPHLSRALLTSHGEKAINVFQDDGAVVEQIRITGADEMMAFDCGGFELK